MENFVVTGKFLVLQNIILHELKDHAFFNSGLRIGNILFGNLCLLLCGHPFAFVRSAVIIVNVLIFDLKRFRKKAETPKTFLEFYLAFLNCGTYEDIEALLKTDTDGIMEDIIRMDMDFLGNDNLWEPFMKKENKNLLALNTARDEVDEMEKKVAIADAMAEQERQAREKAEAMLARERKARVESDAKLFALENAFKDMKSKYDELAALMEKYMTKQPILN